MLTRTDFKSADPDDSGIGVVVCVIIALILIIDYITGGDIVGKDKK